jgi:hypothetical protein
MGVWRLAVICAVGLATPGCISIKESNPVTLNDPLKLAPAAKPVIGATFSCLNVEQRFTCLLPGMLLEVQQTSAKSAGNTLAPVVTRFSWTLPEPDKITQADIFAISYLMTMSHTAKAVSASACLEKWLGTLGTPGRFGNEFYKPFLESMIVNWLPDGSASSVPKGLPNTAQSVQRWMRRLPNQPPPLSASTQPPIRQQVTFSLPSLRQPDGTDPCTTPGGFTAFEHGSPWQTLEDQPIGFPAATFPKKSFYLPDVDNPRTFLRVLIPISVSGVPGTRYVPIDSSIADVEGLLGSEISMVSRLRAFAPTNGNLGASRDRFSIVLTTSDWYDQAEGVAAMPRGCARDILLAPGDQIVLAATPGLSDAKGKEVSCHAN